jgi:hypothetical protein
MHLTAILAQTIEPFSSDLLGQLRWLGFEIGGQAAGPNLLAHAPTRLPPAPPYSGARTNFFRTESRSGHHSAGRRTGLLGGLIRVRPV